MSSLQFREAIPGDEAELLPMMRALAEQEPEVIPFNESAVRAAFHQFLSLPAFGRIWLLYNAAELIGYIILAIGFSFEFRGHDAFIDELYIYSHAPPPGLWSPGHDLRRARSSRNGRQRYSS